MSVESVSQRHPFSVFPKVFLLLQDIRAGNRKKFTRPNQLLPDRKKLTESKILTKC